MDLDRKHSSLEFCSVHPVASNTVFRFSSACASHIKSEDPSPLCPTAPKIKLSLYGVITWAPTALPPAEQPKRVIRLGSPPNSIIFVCIQRIAIC